jgi:hypothetical protein
VFFFSISFLVLREVVFFNIHQEFFVSPELQNPFFVSPEKQKNTTNSTMVEINTNTVQTTISQQTPTLKPFITRIRLRNISVYLQVLLYVRECKFS